MQKQFRGKIEAFNNYSPLVIMLVHLGDAEYKQRTLCTAILTCFMSVGWTVERRFLAK